MNYKTILIKYLVITATEMGVQKHLVKYAIVVVHFTIISQDFFHFFIVCVK